MPCLQNSNRRPNHDWLKLVLLGVVIFFVPMKVVAIDSSPPPARETRAILQLASPVHFQAWISNSADNTVRPATAVSFSPGEKVYLHMTFPELHTGTARINVNWIAPNGKQSGSAEQVLSGPASIHFWLSILGNGPVSEIFTGNEYKQQAYGGWRAHVFFNGEPLTTLPFRVQD